MSCGLGPFKPGRVCVAASNTDSNIKRSDLVGHSNETNIEVNGLQLTALLDTGSNVSTISQGKYKECFSNIPLIPLQEFQLTIEGAGGQLLPYLGYIEVELTVPVLNIQPLKCLMLVTPDTTYSQTVPVILGTNVLKRLMGSIEDSHGVRFRQQTTLPDAWYSTFRCMKIRSREINRHDGRLAVIKCAVATKVTIPSNTTIMITGKLDKQIHVPVGVGLTQMWKEASIPEGVSVTPALVEMNGDRLVNVELSNLTSSPVMIAPSSVLCQVQSCNVVTELDESEKINIPDEPWMEKINIANADLTGNEKSQVYNFIAEWNQVFSKNDLDVGLTSLVKHNINLTDVSPFKQRHRKIPHSMYSEVRDHLRQLLDAGIIRRSQSPWASNIVLVRKKDSSLRLCVDFRQLNRRTVKDAYALPRIDELLEGLGGNKFYSVLDMKSGYHQVEIEEEHIPYTAFTVGPLGFFEYTRLPYGLSNAPATYQRLMESCLADLMVGDEKICHIYLDDIIIASKSFEEHMQCLEKVFHTLKQTGLKLSPKKCFLFQDKVKYVGHVVSAAGIETDPDKTQKISSWPTPKNVDEVRTFLGFASYYRRFVKGFSSIAKPLNQLLTGTTKKKRYRNAKPVTHPVKWEWSTPQEEAFQKLKKMLMEPPVLAYPEYSKPFVLHTDASRDGLGAVLYQVFDGVKRVIAYASRGISKAEQRYPVHKLEFLALKWAITSKFHDYLYGTKFEVFTDNNPMTYVMQKAKLDAASHRWVAALEAYDFQIKYRPGKMNGDADGLSRIPQHKDDNYCEVSTDCLKALCLSQIPTSYVTSLSLSTAVPTGLDLYDEVVPRDWRKLQANDPVVNQFVRAVTSSRKPNITQVRTKEGKILLREFQKLVIRRGVLYRRYQEERDGKPMFQLILPEEFKHQALKGAHDDMGHLGRDKTMSVLRQRMYWPNITKDVDNHLTSCDRCIKRKSSTNIKVPMVSITSSQPMEIVCLDYLSLEMSKGGFENLLVITDHYTKYAVAVPTKNQSAEVTAESLFNHFILHYGFPKRLHSDQGAQFESHLIKELCKLAGIVKSRTTPYNPSSNGITERLNRTLLNMLGTLNPKDKQDWKSQVGHLVHAYNCCKHDSTGFSPYRLMFGRDPRLALDVVLGIVSEQPSSQNYGKYVTKLKDSLKQAYDIASRNITAAQHRQKSNHDVRARAAILEVGDRVLVKVLAVKGTNKIADKWEDCPYVVIDQPNPDIPVYKVQRENDDKTIRTLHRKHLLPFGSLPVISGMEEVSDASQPDVDPVVQEDVPVSDGETDQPELNDEQQSEEPSDSEEDDSDAEYIVRTTETTRPIPVPRIAPVIPDPPPVVVRPDPEVLPRPMPVPRPRRSNRDKKPPDRYGEWVMSHTTNTPEVNPVNNSPNSLQVMSLILDKFLSKC